LVFVPDNVVRSCSDRYDVGTAVLINVGNRQACRCDSAGIEWNTLPHIFPRVITVDVQAEPATAIPRDNLVVAVGIQINAR